MTELQYLTEHLQKNPLLTLFAAALLITGFSLLFIRDRKARKKIRRALNILITVLILYCAFLAIQQERELAQEAEKVKEKVHLDVLPAFSDQPSVIIHDNVPYFTQEDLSREPFEHYGDLDSLGRCTEAFALITPDTLPEDEREEISEIIPTGWKNSRYDFIEGGFLYNRCHLIAFELTSENANEKNLITGTRYMNVTGMEPYENKVAWYVRTTGKSVLYRVTPVFKGKNLVASGVLIEAYSPEDHGAGISFCVFCYNAQPDIEIRYEDGQNRQISFQMPENGVISGFFGSVRLEKKSKYDTI